MKSQQIQTHNVPLSLLQYARRHYACPNARGNNTCGIVNREYIEMEGGKEGRLDEFKGLKLEA